MTTRMRAAAGRRGAGRALARVAALGLLAGWSFHAAAIPTCTVASGATLSFGGIVALASTGNISANTGASLWVNCTADVTAAPGLYSASPRAMTSGAHSLPFSLSLVAPGGTVLPSASPGVSLGIPRNGTNQTVVLYGLIRANDFRTLPAGMYTTSLTLTIEY